MLLNMVLWRVANGLGSTPAGTEIFTGTEIPEPTWCVSTLYNSTFDLSKLMRCRSKSLKIVLSETGLAMISRFSPFSNEKDTMTLEQ